MILRFLPLTLLALVACGQSPTATQTEAAQADPAILNAWIRLPAIAGRPAAAYFTLSPGIAEDRLIGIEVPIAQRAELHESGMTNGTMTMRPLNDVDLTPGESLVFAPGGNHAMLFGIAPGAKPGDVVPITLVLGTGRISGTARLVAAGDPPPQ